MVGAPASGRGGEVQTELGSVSVDIANLQLRSSPGN